MSGMICGFLHIDLDAFFVSVEQALDPALRGKPVIVGGKPDRRGVVASASYEARAFGIHSAMPLAKAYRLCPRAIFLEGSYSLYREASDKFMAILADFSPGLEPGGLEEAFLDVTGCDIFGTPRQIAVSIKDRVRKELQLIASVGIAGCKVVAKIASGLGKPDGLIEVPSGQEKAFLSPLAINKLPGVGPKTEQSMMSVGITTIGKLAALNPETAKRLLGESGITLYRQANGIDTRKIDIPDDAKSMSRETTLEQDTIDPEVLRAVVGYLCERLGYQLREHGKQAKTVNLKLRYDDFETITRSHSTAQPIATDEALFTAAYRLLELALAGKRKAVRLLGVGVSNFTGESLQLSLFDPSMERQERLDKVIDRIRKKYGFSAVQTGRTMVLSDIFESADKDYKLHTPSLSR
jgi:DNA polymerase-4